MAELATIPIYHFEYAALFKRPIFALWMDKPAVVQTLFNAFAPWNLGIDDIGFHTAGKASEQGISFKLPQKRITFFFGPVSCKFTKEDVDWTRADETTALFQLARNTFLGEIDTAIEKQNTVIAFHLQPKNKTFIDILAPFIPNKIQELNATEAVETAAVIVKWRKMKVTLDGSGVVANGIFVRFDREFPDSATLEEICRGPEVGRKGPFQADRHRGR